MGRITKRQSARIRRVGARSLHPFSITQRDVSLRRSRSGVRTGGRGGRGALSMQRHGRGGKISPHWARPMRLRARDCPHKACTYICVACRPVRAHAEVAYTCAWGRRLSRLPRTAARSALVPGGTLGRTAAIDSAGALRNALCSRPPNAALPAFLRAVSPMTDPSRQHASHHDPRPPVRAES
jgi:hypothetical protein